uniref:Tryptophan RNA-binding attentuator protein-inhibitory protein n=1 Tax=Bacillus phage KoopaTroopa TaxID=3234046 RepID=A0AB39C758_9CAUD
MSSYQRIACDSCNDLTWSEVGTDSHKLHLCKDCFEDLNTDKKKELLRDYYIPCLGCDGKFYTQNHLGELEYCDQCGGSGRHKVTKEEYDKFWKHFSKDDFI